MGQAKGVVAITFFFIFTIFSFIISFGLGNDAAASGYDIEIAIFFLVEFLLFSSTGLLIPGIFCILGKKYNKAKWYYALIPTTLLWILIYTMVVAILAPTSFVSSFLEFLGLGMGGSIVLAIIVLCGSYDRFYHPRL